MGKTCYGDFLSSPENISTNILADRLRQLEDNGLVEKFSDPDNAKKFVYLLTDKGLDLTPVMLELIRWGARNDEHTGAPRSYIRKLDRDFDGMVAQIRTANKKKRTAFLNSLP